MSTAHEFLRSADALLVIGSKVGAAELWGGDITSDGPIIRVDIMRDQTLCNLDPEIELPGNSAAVVPQLIEALGDLGERAAQDLTEVFARLDQEGRQWAPELAELNEAIMNAVPADTIIGGDSSQVTCRGSTTFFRAQQPNSLLYMGTYATLGYGLPASIGAKLAAPARPVVCLVGDGALMFSI